MATISLTTISNGDNLDATTVNNNFTTISGQINGLLDTTNISPTAAITDAQLATVSWVAWTPTIYKNDKSTTITPTINEARYRKIGRQVTVNISISAAADPAGVLYYTSLPSAARSSTVDRVTGSGIAINNSAYDMGYSLIKANDTAYIAYEKRDQSVWSASGSNGFNLTFTYESNT